MENYLCGGWNNGLKARQHLDPMASLLGGKVALATGREHQHALWCDDESSLAVKDRTAVHLMTCFDPDPLDRIGAG
jgi:hypothetical protein